MSDKQVADRVRTHYESSLDYAICCGLPLWCDEQVVVYVAGEHCVVSAADLRRGIYPGKALCERSETAAPGGLLWAAWVAGLQAGAPVLAYRDYEVVFGGGCAAIVHGDRVSIIGARTQLIKWDGTREGRRAIERVIRDGCTA